MESSSSGESREDSTMTGGPGGGRLSIKSNDPLTKDLNVITIFNKETKSFQFVLKCPQVEPSCPYTTERKEEMEAHIRNCHNPDHEKPFQCSYINCNYRCKEKSTIKHHVQSMHKDEKPFSCPLEGCSFTTKHRENLRNHLNITHSEARPHQCPNCPYSAKIKESLNEHIKRVHTEKEMKFFCEHCDFGATSKYKVDLHIKWVHSNAQHRCPEEGCSYASNHKWQVDKHYKYNHLKIRLWCPYRYLGCEFGGVCQAHLERHINKHHPQEAANYAAQNHGYPTQTHEYSKHVKNRKEKTKKLSCPFNSVNGCDYVARRSDYLKRHIEKKHKSNEANQTDASKSQELNQPKLECDRCHRKFGPLDALDFHNQLEHSGDLQTAQQTQFNFRCVYIECSKKFKDEESLNSHLKTHYSKRKLMCKKSPCTFVTFCEKKFYFHMRNAHAASNPNIKPKFECHILNCQARFFHKDDLTDHIEEAHKLNACYMPNCSFLNSDPDVVDDHINVIHLRHHQYKCSTPDCRFITYSKIMNKYHQLIDHGIDIGKSEDASRSQSQSHSDD